MPLESRSVARIVRGMPTSDGAGVKLTRVIGSQTLDHLDPFLLLDEFKSDDPSDYIAGFPDHPHRGFETVTYMLAGSMEHADHAGNRGLLTGGGAQWMTAGRGIIHSETPRQEKGLMWGFQLWVNLPARLKMTAPRYQDIEPPAIPEIAIGRSQKSVVRIITGSFQGQTGPVREIATAPLYLDVRLQSGDSFEAEVPSTHAAFVYVYDGGASIGDRAVERQELAVLEAGAATVRVDASEKSNARFLLVAAAPLGEPIARYGPFVMNTREEIHQAFEDFRAGRLG